MAWNWFDTFSKKPTEYKATIEEKEVIKKYNINLLYLKGMIEGSFISRRNTIVVPGPKMNLAMEILVTPIIRRLSDLRFA